MWVFPQYSRQGGHFLFGIDTARRIVGGVDHHDSGPVRECAPQLVCGHFEVLFDSRLNGDHFSSSEVRHVGIADPIGGGQDDLVTLVDKAQHHVHQAVLGPGGDNDLIWAVFQTVVPLQLVTDGLTHFNVAGYWRVVGEVLFDGFDARSLDGVRGVKVRFAQ